MPRAVRFADRNMNEQSIHIQRERDIVNGPNERFEDRSKGIVDQKLDCSNARKQLSHTGIAGTPPSALRRMDAMLIENH